MGRDIRRAREQELRQYIRELEYRCDLLQRRWDTELDKYRQELYDRFLSVYVINIALAIYDVYGYQPTRINKIINAFNARIAMDQATGDAQAELKEKTGIEFYIVEELNNE